MTEEKQKSVIKLVETKEILTKIIKDKKTMEFQERLFPGILNMGHHWAYRIKDLPYSIQESIIDTIKKELEKVEKELKEL